MISFPSPCPVQTATFNIWPNLASWVIFEIYPLDLSMCWPNEVNWHVESESSRFFALPTLQNNKYVEPTKLSSQVISKIYPPLDPTRQYIQHIQPPWHLESCLKCSFPPLHIIAFNIEHIMSFFFAPPNPLKKNMWKKNKTSILSSFPHLPGEAF